MKGIVLVLGLLLGATALANYKEYQDQVFAEWNNARTNPYLFSVILSQLRDTKLFEDYNYDVYYCTLSSFDSTTMDETDCPSEFRIDLNSYS